MDLGTAMELTKRFGTGRRLKLTFMPDEEGRFGPGVKRALDDLYKMNWRYYILDGSNLRRFEAMLSSGFFGDYGREVTVELTPEFMGKRRQFLAPLVDALESVEEGSYR